MILKYIFLVIVICTSIFNKVFGQDDCVPGVIQNLRITANATLFWELRPNERCHVTKFNVKIVGDADDSYEFSSYVTHVQLSFLNVCEEWRFTVIPISFEGVTGLARSLVSRIPLPEDSDLSLQYFNATILEDGGLYLQWDLSVHTHRDCELFFRLTFLDEFSGIMYDIYIQGNSTRITSLSSCVSYQLEIRAINRGHPIIEGPQREVYIEIPPKPQVVPSLRAIDIQATTITMSWTLERTNRCPVRNIYVDAGNNFNISIPLSDSAVPHLVDVELKALRANTMYYMKVYVENSGGISPAFPIAVQTLELSSH